ncbi:13365_t:CDS:2 [Entrophospora sp. SA101]|nr:13365_t:CDS:2 [Entrophospora sp. SA101]
MSTKPLANKAITSALSYCLQELLAQELSGINKKRRKHLLSRKIGAEEGKTVEGVEKIQNVDDKVILSMFVDDKVIKMTLYGLLISGPLNHYVFMVLDKLFNRISKGAAAKILQVITFQLIFTPIHYIVMAIISGSRDLNQIISNFKKSILKLELTACAASLVTLIFAQSFLDPRFWASFFNLSGFTFGLIANVKAKNDRLKKIELH